MTSTTKIQSACANGPRSHGPVTAEGKQRSARNATRHGLLANTVVLEGESNERFHDLLASLTEEWQPRPWKRWAVARWRYLRVLSLQRMELDLEIARQPHSSKVVSATLAFRHLADNSRVLDLLLRDEVSFDRQFTRALNALIKLRPIPAMCGQDETPVDETKVAPAAQPSHGLEFPNEPKPSEDAAGFRNPSNPEDQVEAC